MRNIRRILMSATGVMITAISVGAFKFASFGVDPFQSFMCGVDACFPIDFGTLYVIVNALLLIFSLVFDRHYIGIATFINLFFLGLDTSALFRNGELKLALLNIVASNALGLIAVFAGLYVGKQCVGLLK